MTMFVGLGDGPSRQPEQRIRNLSGATRCMMIKGKLNEALFHAELLIDRRPANPARHHAKGLVLLHMNRPEEAMRYLTKALSLAPNCKEAFLPAGFANGRVGRYGRAAQLMNRAEIQSGEHILPLMAPVENRLRKGDNAGVLKVLDHLLKAYRIEEINQAPEVLFRRHSLVAISWRNLIPPIVSAIKEKTEKIQAMQKQ